MANNGGSIAGRRFVCGVRQQLCADAPLFMVLGNHEFKLLRYMMLNPNRVLSKAQILDHVWEYDFNGDAGIVESYISYLRRKLEAAGLQIRTVRGLGYLLQAEVA